MLVTPKELKGMGVGALITNAYIFSQSNQYSERVREEGLHKLLDFDGVIMTDSGSFHSRSMARSRSPTSRRSPTSATSEATSGCRSISPPPRMPTARPRNGNLRSRWNGSARQRNSSGTMPRLPGLVQGSLYQDLRERAGKEVGDLGFSFCPIGAVVPLMGILPGTGTSLTWSLPQTVRSPARPASTSSVPATP